MNKPSHRAHPVSPPRVVRRPAPARSVPPASARRRSRYLRSLSTVFVLLASTATIPAKAAPIDDQQAVAALDTAFQAAVKVNDAATISRILADDMILVTGRGKVVTAAEHIERANTRFASYEKQDEIEGTQTVRVYGDTAIVTALLWIKGADRDGKAFDYKVWFSDTYVRRPDGWKYVFGQASLPLPNENSKPIGI